MHTYYIHTCTYTPTNIPTLIWTHTVCQQLLEKYYIRNVTNTPSIYHKGK